MVGVEIHTANEVDLDSSEKFAAKIILGIDQSDKKERHGVRYIPSGLRARMEIIPRIMISPVKKRADTEKG